MAEKIELVKASFKNGMQQEGLECQGLRAMFSIGSAANNESFRNEFFQDFDIHLFFNHLDISKKTLGAVKRLFKEVARKHEDQDTAVEFMVKDQPWKMIPRKASNIGIHGTVLDSLDFQRRIERNYILGLNMFRNAEVLYGKLDFPQKKISVDQFFSEVGGIGWLEELYYRILPFTDPGNKIMHPMIVEISYYFGLSPLLHFYYLHNNTVATRQECFAFFVAQGSVPDAAKEAARFLMRKGVNNTNDCLAMLNYAFEIMQFVRSQFGEDSKEDCEKEKQMLPESRILAIDEGSMLISEVLGRQISINQRHCLITGGDFNQIQSEIGRCFGSFSNQTPDDYVESIHSIIEGGLSEVNRLYFWIFGKNERFLNRTDFSLHDPTLDSLLYSWERGITTFIQRLHEAYLNKEHLDATDVLLAKILALMAYSDFLLITTNKIPAIKELVSTFEKDEKLDRVNQLNIEDQFFSYLGALYSLARKIITAYNG